MGEKRMTLGKQRLQHKKMTALRLGLPFSTLSNFMNNRRGISWKVAKLMELRDPRLKAEYWMDKDVEKLAELLDWKLKRK